MGKIRDLMGERRKSQIDKAINSFKDLRKMLTKEEIDQIINLKSSGLTHKEIANKFNRERSTISKLLKS